MIKTIPLSHESLENRQLLTSICDSNGYSSATANFGTPAVSILCSGGIAMNLSGGNLPVATVIVTNSTLSVGPTSTPGETALNIALYTSTTVPPLDGSIACNTTITAYASAQVPVGEDGYVPTASFFGVVPSTSLTPPKVTFAIGGTGMLANGTAIAASALQTPSATPVLTLMNTVCANPFIGTGGTTATVSSTISIGTNTDFAFAAGAGSVNFYSNNIPNTNVPVGLWNTTLPTGPGGKTLAQYVYSY